jgi:hypothetical protein
MLTSVSMNGLLVMLFARQRSAIEKRPLRALNPCVWPKKTARTAPANGPLRARGLRAIAIAALAAAACGERGGGAPEPSGAPVSPSSAPSPIASAGSTAPTTAPPRAPSSATPSEPSESSRAGSYRGDYEARRGTVTLEPGVVEPSWKLDRGQSFSGKGTIELEVDAAGRARGRLVGPLGELTARGEVDGDVIAMELVPAVDDAPPAFRGTLQASFEAGRLRGELRVVSGDGRVVRAASIEAARR